MVRSINIVPVLNGFVVQVGCQTVAFNSVGSLACAIAEYYQNPEATEKKFVKERVNNTMDSPSQVYRVVDSPVCSPAPQQGTGECCAEPVPRNPPSLR
jgi:hypothetical protein